MIYFKNLTKIVFLTLVIVSFSACNSGSGGAGGGNNPTPTPNQWVQVGTEPPLASNILMYDRVTNQLFMGLENSHLLCSISADAAPSDEWSCTTSPPQITFLDKTNYTTDGNGHIYFAAAMWQKNADDTITKIENIYTYSTLTKTWSIQQMDQIIVFDKEWFYSNGLIYDGYGETAINLTTGTVSSYSPLAPSVNGGHNSNLISTLNGVVYYQGSNLPTIFSRNIQPSNIVTQFGKSLLDLFGITAMEQNIYVCGGSMSDGYVSYLPDSANSDAEWNKLPPPNYFPETPTTIFQPGCIFMTSGNGLVFIYIPVMYADSQQEFGYATKFVVMKYKI